VVQVQDIEILFQLPDMEQVRHQLWVIVAAFALDLLDDELGVTLHKQLSNPKGQSDVQLKDQGLILCHVVDCFELQVYHVLELFPNWSKE
jgi:hypothetical protein